MLLRNKIITTLIAGVLFIRAGAQYKLEEPILINKEHGLPTNNVRSVQKSKDGFMWMGTSEGLCRFDGQQVKTYVQGPDFSTSLFENTVLAVLPVDNEIWMGTAQGISVMTTHNERFRHYQLNNQGKVDSIYRRFDQHMSVLYLTRHSVCFRRK